uniref:Interleukin-17F n=1 Tax=Chrysemys picta bellii TaxID=8478 RepID=A0A8C3F8B9_CHRPI
MTYLSANPASESPAKYPQGLNPTPFKSMGALGTLGLILKSSSSCNQALFRQKLPLKLVRPMSIAGAQTLTQHNINEDPNRFPQVIAQAKCRHYSCVDSTGQQDYSMNSIPIQHEILVLQRERRGCQHTYRLEKQLVTVGCTCARPIIHYLQ